MARRRKKKSNLFARFFTFLGKALVWVIVALAKAVYYIFKGIFLGIGHLFKSKGKKDKKTKKEKPGAQTDANVEKKKSKSKGIKAEAKYQSLTSKETKEGTLEDFETRLEHESLIIAVAGKRGSGKSALGFKLLENIYAKTKRPCFALGPKQSSIPRWINSIDNLDDVENNGVVLVDEGAISFGSRSSMSKKNKELSKLLAIARHKDLTLIFITQNTGMIDKNILNLCDTIILKEGSLLQEKMERSVMKDMYKTANENLKTIPSKDRKAYCYIFDSDFEGLISIPLPSFWSSKVSKNQA